MRVSDLEAKLYPKLDYQLSQEGFTFRKKLKHFYRPISIGWDDIGFGIHKHGDLVHVLIYIGVRHNAMEDLVTEVMSKLIEEDVARFSPVFVESVKTREKGLTATVGTELGNIGEQQRNKVWEIATDADIELASTEMIELIHRDAEPYFAQFRATQDFLERLARDDRETVKWSAVRAPRAIGAVAAAFVLRDRETFDRVRAAKEHLLTSPNDEFYQFRPFAQYLAEHWED